MITEYQDSKFWLISRSLFIRLRGAGSFMNMWRRLFRARPSLLAILIASLALANVGAGSGSVLALSASGGGGYGDTISISATVRADGKINNSNLYYEVRAPNGTVVATSSAGVPKLEDGETFSHGWATNNGGFPETGTYTVSLCWSPGNSHNCGIASSSTSFYSVPTFGTVLGIAALALLAIWLWSARHTLFGEKVPA
jgi:hypothetical protein